MLQQERTLLQIFFEVMLDSEGFFFESMTGPKHTGIRSSGMNQWAGHDVNFCSDLPRRASEIQFSLALLQLSLALEKLYIIIL